METRLAPRIRRYGERGQFLADCLFSWIEGRNYEESNFHLTWNEEEELFTLFNHARSSDVLTDEEYSDLIALNVVGGPYAHPVPRYLGENHRICLRDTPIPRRGLWVEEGDISARRSQLLPRRGLWVEEGDISARRSQLPLPHHIGLGQRSYVVGEINMSAFSGQILSVIGQYMHNIRTGQLLDVMGNLFQDIGTMGHCRLRHTFGLGTLCMSLDHNGGTWLAWVVRRIGDWGEVSSITIREENNVSCFPLGPGFLWVACYHRTSGRSTIEIRRGNTIIQELANVNDVAYPLSTGRFATFNLHASEVIVWAQSHLTDNVLIERRIFIPGLSRVEAHCGYLHLKVEKYRYLHSSVKATPLIHGKLDRLGRFMRPTPDDNENEHIVFQRGSQAFLTKEGDQWRLHFRQVNNVRMSSHSLNTSQKPTFHLFLGSFLCLSQSDQISIRISIWSDSGLILHKFSTAIPGTQNFQFADNGRDTIAMFFSDASTRVLAVAALRFDDISPENTSTIPSSAVNLSIHHGDVVEDTLLTMRSILQEIARKPNTLLQPYDVDAILMMLQPLPASERSNIFQMCCAISEHVPLVPLFVVDLIRYEKEWSTVLPYYKRLAAMTDNRQEIADILRRMICGPPLNYENLVATVELFEAICPRLAPVDRFWLKDIIATRSLELRPTLVHDCASLVEALPPVFVQNVSLQESFRAIVDREMDTMARQNLLQYAQRWVQIHFYAPPFQELRASEQKMIVSGIASLPEQEKLPTLEICKPILEEISGVQCRWFLDGILKLPMDQRRAARKIIMEKRYEEVVRDYSMIRVLSANNEMLRILGISHIELNSEVRVQELQKIRSHLLSYLPSLSPVDAEDLLGRCLQIQRPVPFSSDISPEIVRQSWIELETNLDAKLAPSRRAFFGRIRADAPELANAWCTLNGIYIRRDFSSSLMRSSDIATVGIAVMTWMLIEKHPNEQERQNMKYEYGWALAQCINLMEIYPDDKDNHRVCGHNMQVRFITTLQGPDRYPTITIDFATLQQKFTAHLVEVDKSLGGKNPVRDDFQRFLDNLLDDYMSSYEINWFLEELQRYCITAGWEFEPSSLSVIGGFDSKWYD